MSPLTSTTNIFINEFVLRNLRKHGFFKALNILPMAVTMLHDEQPWILCGKWQYMYIWRVTLKGSADRGCGQLISAEFAYVSADSYRSARWLCWPGLGLLHIWVLAGVTEATHLCLVLLLLEASQACSHCSWVSIRTGRDGQSLLRLNPRTGVWSLLLFSIGLSKSQAEPYSLCEELDFTSLVRRVAKSHGKGNGYIEEREKTIITINLPWAPNFYHEISL